MSDRSRDDRSRREGTLLSAEELRARRTAWRRRRARRRLSVVAALAAALIAVLAVVLGGGVVGHRRVASAAAATHAVPAHRRPSSHRERPRRPPQGNIARVLRHTSYVQLAGKRRREMALTFDDGPGPYTPAILRILRRMHVTATFFVVGRSVGAFPSLVAAEERDGFEVGDHTETHPPLAELAPGMQAAQIAGAAGAIRRAGASYPDLLRPPYGSFDEATLAVLRQMRMLLVLWSADTKDFARPGVTRIIYTAVSGAQPGAIILMHDGGGDRSQTVQALPRIIMRLRQRGFRLVTVSRLVADDPPPRNQPPPHSLSGGV